MRKLAPGTPIRRTVHRPSRLWTPDGGEHELAELQGRDVVALAGIGNPQAFAATLRGLGAEVSQTAFFPDHHPYTRDELAQVARGAAGRVVVMTEKDAVRVGEWAGVGELWVLGIELGEA